MFNLEQLEKAMPKQTFELFIEGFSKLEELSHWTLVGGTALSIHYRHRLSEDLDFFIKHSSLEQSRKSIFSMMQKKQREETKLINNLLETPSLIPKYAFMFFGLERLSLIQKFASIYDPNMVLKCLELASFDMTYMNISGKNILDYEIPDEKMFKLLLSYTYEIPDEWMNSRLYSSKEKMPLILLENSLITCIVNGSDNDRIAKIATTRGIDLDVFNTIILKKKEILKKNEKRDSL